MIRISLAASEEKSFENVHDGRRADGRRIPQYTIGSPTHLRHDIWVFSNTITFVVATFHQKKRTKLVIFLFCFTNPHCSLIKLLGTSNEIPWPLLMVKSIQSMAGQIVAPL